MTGRFASLVRHVAVTASIALGTVAGLAPRAAHAQDVKLLNVSYDPTRELYDDVNAAFAQSYKASAGKSVAIEQSHGGSGKQARSVIDGLQADVVTLGLASDVYAIQKAGLIQAGWESRLPNDATPYTSSIVFVVRKGNPKQVKDWPDLIKPGVAVITPNPKTSAGARWNFVAAYGYGGGAVGTPNALPDAAGKFPEQHVDDAKAKAYVAALFKNVPVLDTGARGSTVTFAQKNIGDVLIAWENEAWLALKEFGQDRFEIVYPSVSVLAEPPVAVVDKNVDARGTRAAAEAYLKFLYTPEAQEIIAYHHYRPRDPAVLAKAASELPPLKLFTLKATFGGWDQVQPKFFGDGGVFDQIYQAAK